MKTISNIFGPWGISFLLIYCGSIGAASANDAGMVLKLTGSLTAKSADGALRVLAMKNAVAGGDILFTGRDSYARIRFSDGAEIDMRPNAHLLIDKYNFDEAHPEKDSAVFSLLKGSIRAVSGLIGKRGDQDSYEMKTPDATLGIRGTKYGLLSCHSDCQDITSADGKPAQDGLHAEIDEGAVLLRNEAGDRLFNAGEFGYVSSRRTVPEQAPPEQAIKIELPSNILGDWQKGDANSDNGDGSGENARECPARK